MRSEIVNFNMPRNFNCTFDMRNERNLTWSLILSRESCFGNTVFLPFFHASTDIFLTEMLRGMLTDINNVGGWGRKGGTDWGTKIISCHRVYGSLALVEHRERVSISRQRSGWCARGRTILFSGEGGEGRGGGEMRGAHPGAAHTRRIRQRQYVLGRSPCQRHCRSRIGRGRRMKKRRTRKREKIRLGINADLTVDDWSPPIVRRWFAGIARRASPLVTPSLSPQEIP